MAGSLLTDGAGLSHFPKMTGLVGELGACPTPLPGSAGSDAIKRPAWLHHYPGQFAFPENNALSA